MVKLNEIIGDTRKIKYVVPQVSALISWCSQKCLKVEGSIVIFSDDTCLPFSNRPWDGVYAKGIIRLCRVLKCLGDINVSLNIEKNNDYYAFTNDPQ